MKHSYPTRPSRRLSCLLLTFIVSGCAATADHRLPTVELSASALAPVGRTIPVFIKRRCTDNCGFASHPLSRQQVAALNESGEYVQAIPPDDAAKLAGGTEGLLDALDARESHASTIARESTFQAENTSRGIFAILAVPFALVGTASMATQPDETVEKMRLNEVTIPECPSAHGCPVGASASALHHDVAIGGDQGWVFFPMGKYTQVKASYNWLPSPLNVEEEQTEIIIAPWNGSSSSLGSLSTPGAHSSETLANAPASITKTIAFRTPRATSAP